MRSAGETPRYQLTNVSHGFLYPLQDNSGSNDSVFTIIYKEVSLRHVLSRLLEGFHKPDLFVCLCSHCLSIPHLIVTKKVKFMVMPEEK